MKKAYLIYDGRALSGNPDDIARATVYHLSGYDREKAIKDLEMWPDGVLYELDADGRKLSNPVFVKAGSVYGNNAEEAA